MNEGGLGRSPAARLLMSRQLVALLLEYGGALKRIFVRYLEFEGEFAALTQFEERWEAASQVRRATSM